MADKNTYLASKKFQTSDHAISVVKEFERLRSNRGTLDSHFQEIAERMVPAHSRSFTQKNMGEFAKGDKRNEFLFDATASLALQRFAAILDSLLTPRNQTWHRLKVDDPYLAKDRDVKLYFDQVNQSLFKHRYTPKANFASQNQQNYISLGAYGTGAMFIDRLHGQKGLRYKNIHLGEIYFVENHQGIIEKALRYFPMTARQMHQRWGDALPDQILDAAKNNSEQEFYIIHLVKPREDVDPNLLNYKGMPWASHYISVSGNIELEEGGYTSFPYSISRYMQAPNEVYGRSPGMDILPNVKTLNEQKKVMLKQAHRAVDPVLLAHDDGIVDSFSLRPGAINAGGVSSDGRPLVHALPMGQYQIGKESMDDEKAVVNDAFLVSLFQILIESPQMTATEVLERAKEKGILIAPTIGRQQSEYLGPMIEREIDVLSSQNLLPPMPLLLKEAAGQFKIEYDSPLSRAQRSEEASGLMRTVETALNIVNITQDKTPLDHFNWDVIIPEIADIQGIPNKWMNSVAQVSALRENRNAAAQRQELIQAGPAAAAITSASAKMQAAQKA